MFSWNSDTVTLPVTSGWLWDDANVWMLNISVNGLKTLIKSKKMLQFASESIVTQMPDSCLTNQSLLLCFLFTKWELSEDALLSNLREMLGVLSNHPTMYTPGHSQHLLHHPKADALSTKLMLFPHVISSTAFMLWSPPKCFLGLWIFVAWFVSGALALSSKNTLLCKNMSCLFQFDILFLPRWGGHLVERASVILELGKVSS